MELTVPWEDLMEEAHKQKKDKYLELTEEGRRKRWKAHCEPIKIDCRGLSGQTLDRSPSLLGRGLQERRATPKNQ